MQSRAPPKGDRGEANAFNQLRPPRGREDNGCFGLRKQDSGSDSQNKRQGTPITHPRPLYPHPPAHLHFYFILPPAPPKKEPQTIRDGNLPLTWFIFLKWRIEMTEMSVALCPFSPWLIDTESSQEKPVGETWVHRAWREVHLDGNPPLRSARGGTLF